MTGTCFIMWLGEQMTERGVGNGMSVIIFSGIVAGFWGAVANSFELMKAGQTSPGKMIILLGIVLLSVYLVIFFEQAQRKIPVQYAKKIVGRRMYQGQNTTLPLKLNMSGVIPPIFASSLLMFPATIASLSGASWLHNITQHLTYGGWLYIVAESGLIIFFCYFYTSVTINPVDVADNMKKFGGYVPGIRPGKNTSDYIEYDLERITVLGATYLVGICILPFLMQQKGGVSFYFGGTSLLIVVGVALDTMAQIEAHLLSHHYEGFLGPQMGRLKGRRAAA
jgi:preprotein translocase subunit SecY